MSQSNDGVFRLPPLLPNSSSPSSHSNSLTSTHRMGYWKADSQSPIASNALPAVDSHRHRCSWQVRFLNGSSTFLYLFFLLYLYVQDIKLDLVFHFVNKDYIKYLYFCLTGCKAALEICNLADGFTRCMCYGSECCLLFDSRSEFVIA